MKRKLAADADVLNPPMKNRLNKKADIIPIRCLQDTKTNQEIPNNPILVINNGKGAGNRSFFYFCRNLGKCGFGCFLGFFSTEKPNFPRLRPIVKYCPCA